MNEAIEANECVCATTVHIHVIKSLILNQKAQEWAILVIYGDDVACYQLAVPKLTFPADYAKCLANIAEIPESFIQTALSTFGSIWLKDIFIQLDLHN